MGLYDETRQCVPCKFVLKLIWAGGSWFTVLRRKSTMSWPKSVFRGGGRFAPVLWWWVRGAPAGRFVVDVMVASANVFFGEHLLRHWSMGPVSVLAWGCHFMVCCSTGRVQAIVKMTENLFGVRSVQVSSAEVVV
jgi:hypothetical protein